MHIETDRSYPWRNSFCEEIVNSATHAFGTILSASGLGVMAVLAAIYGNAWHITSVAVFGGTLILLYAVSTLYHSTHQPKVKAILRLLDHSAIFLLIAGTYTPFTLVSLRGAWGWALFGAIWTMAILGILLEILTTARWRFLSIILYVSMGWLVIVAFSPLSSALSSKGLMMLMTGGLFYTFGILFYTWKSLPYNHAIWHLFVLTGSILHYFTVLFYVIPL